MLLTEQVVKNQNKKLKVKELRGLIILLPVFQSICLCYSYDKAAQCFGFVQQNLFWTAEANVCLKQSNLECHYSCTSFKEEILIVVLQICALCCSLESQCMWHRQTAFHLSFVFAMLLTICPCIPCLDSQLQQIILR